MKRWLVTGGAGFIGTNLVEHLIERGDAVVVVDDLSRGGSEQNAAYLRDRHGIEPHEVDISNAAALSALLDAMEPFDAIAHLAGQVSFLASLADPRRDFEVNALGTLNLLEYVRQRSPETVLVGMSSNKVYGDLDQIRIEEQATRYVAPDYPQGFDEDLPLAFHGPYGCSKGAADQYLADYGRMFGLRTASLRQSSVYGPHQHPRSDQGWVAHLVQEARDGRVIRLNGVGKQVRDLLHATDLARLFVTLEERIQPGAGHQLNVGGGVTNSLSILELFAWLEERTGQPVAYETGPVRPSDQRVFVSANSAVRELTGWEPQVDLETGLTSLLSSG